VSKNIKTAFPKWMVAATLASSLAVLAVGFLATQMFAWESAIYREHKQWKSEIETQVAPTLDRRVEGSSATAPQEENSDTVRRWEGVLAQINHPYLKAQQDLLSEVSSIASPGDLNAVVFDSQAVWSKLPDELARFVQSNRELLDSVYDLVLGPIADPWIPPTFYNGPAQKVRELVFWDMANCLASKDQERFKKGMEAYHRLSHYTGHVGVVDNDALICLLHRRLDEQLISAEEASKWLDQMSQIRPIAMYFDVASLRAKSYFLNFSQLFEGGWVLPSVKKELFEEYCSRNNLWADPFVQSEQSYLSSLKYYTLAVRVALLQAVEEKRGHPKLPEDVLARLRIPGDIERILSSMFKGNYSATSLFEYVQKTPNAGELEFKLLRDISSGPFPIRTTYEIQIPTDPK
jgi:hypothetical protein